jgi:hypothetical protein
MFIHVSQKFKKGLERNWVNGPQEFTKINDFKFGPGLPDGLFSNQKSQFGYFWRTFCWYILWPFGIWLFNIVCGQLVYFSQFGMFGPRKIWQPWFGRRIGRNKCLGRFFFCSGQNVNRRKLAVEKWCDEKAARQHAWHLLKRKMKFFSTFFS